MLNLDLRLQKPLEDYIEYYEKLTTRSVPLLLKFADISMAFIDPVLNVRGQDTAQKVLLRRFELFPSIRYEVQDFCWGRREAMAYVRWSMSFEAKTGLLKKSERKKIEGMLEIGFSPEGKVCSHTEFWNNTQPFLVKQYQLPIGAKPKVS